MRKKKKGGTDVLVRKRKSTRDACWEREGQSGCFQERERKRVSPLRAGGKGRGGQLSLTLGKLAGKRVSPLWKKNLIHSFIREGKGPPVQVEEEKRFSSWEKKTGSCIREGGGEREKLPRFLKSRDAPLRDRRRGVQFIPVGGGRRREDALFNISLK